MPREHLSMRKIKEVLRLKFEQGLNNRDVATGCRVGVATVHEYLIRAKAAGLGWPLPDHLGDDELERKLFPPAPATLAARQAILPDWSVVARELRRKGVTLQLLWEEYHAAHPDGYGYSRFCALFRAFEATVEPRMRQIHKAGEKLFVDYAGMTVPVVFDRKTGELREAQVFVATLGASNYTYAEATWTQGLDDWIGSHVRAFAFLRGTPRVVVPDNLKTGVTSPHLYEPDVNVTYLDMARHYSVAVVPTRIVKPRDKAKVEVHVQIAERQILARLRDRRFLCLPELNEAIWELLDKLNDAPFQKLAGSRRQLFLEVDAPVLGRLPVDPYVLATWKKARVGIDYHIDLDRRYYSVPYTLIHKQVDVRKTTRIVEIFFKSERIASHQRATHVGQYVTCPEHMPPSHRAHAEWTPERFARWARQTGGATCAAVQAILDRYEHPEQAFRGCLGIMRLGQRYGQDRLESACVRILAAGHPTYKSIESILSKGLDSLPVQTVQASAIDHANIRGAGYYAPPAERSRPNDTDKTSPDLLDNTGEHHA